MSVSLMDVDEWAVIESKNVEPYMAELLAAGFDIQSVLEYAEDFFNGVSFTMSFAKDKLIVAKAINIAAHNLHIDRDSQNETIHAENRRIAGLLEVK